jgi:hypothetical protein
MNDESPAATGIEYPLTGEWATPRNQGPWWCGRRPRTLAEGGAGASAWKSGEKLGAGVFGKVTRYALSAGGDGASRDVAVKEFSEEVVDTTETLQEMVARDLRHPNVAKVGGVAVVGGRLALVSNLAAANLATFVNHQRLSNDEGALPTGVKPSPMTYDDFRVIVYQMLRGMAYLQSMFVRFGDLHTKNMLITEEPIPDARPPTVFHRVLITDFGAAMPMAMCLVPSTAPGARSYYHGGRPTSLLMGLSTPAQFVNDAIELLASAVTDTQTAPEEFSDLYQRMTEGTAPRTAAAFGAWHWLGDRVFRTTPLTDDKYVSVLKRRGDGESAIAPAGAWYGACTPAHFVETMLPPEGDRPIRPVMLDRRGEATAESIRWAIAANDGPGASLPAGAVSREEYASRCAVVVGARRPARVAVHALQLARRCPRLSGALGPQCRSFLRAAEIVRSYPPSRLTAVEPATAFVPVLTALDYDVFHPTAADYVAAHDRWSDVASAEGASDFIASENGVSRLVELAMTDWDIAGAPAAGVSRAVVDLCYRIFSVPRPWTPPGNGPTPAAVAAAVVSGYYSIVSSDPGTKDLYAAVEPLLGRLRAQATAHHDAARTHGVHPM